VNEVPIGTKIFSAAVENSKLNSGSDQVVEPVAWLGVGSRVRKGAQWTATFQFDSAISLGFILSMNMPPIVVRLAVVR